MSAILIAASGSLAAATQSKYESLTGLSFLVRLRAAELLSIADSGGATYSQIIAMTGKNNFRLEIVRNNATLFINTRDSSNGGSAFISVLRSALPGTGFVNVYGYLAASAAAAAIYNGSTALDSTSNTTAWGALITGASTGNLTIGGAFAHCVDAAYVFNRALTAAEIYTQPTVGMSGLVGGYPISEGAGSTTADMVSGGTALTLSSATWDTDGDWNGAGGGGSSAGIMRRRRLLL